MDQNTKVVELENFVDEAVMSFIIDMKYKLRLNNHKGHWKDYEQDWMVNRLRQEFEELKAAIKNAELKKPCPSQADLLAIVHECADVSNFAMMIADNVKRAIRKDEPTL